LGSEGQPRRGGIHPNPHRQQRLREKIDRNLPIPNDPHRPFPQPPPGFQGIKPQSINKRQIRAHLHDPPLLFQPGEPEGHVERRQLAFQFPGDLLHGAPAVHERGEPPGQGALQADGSRLVDEPDLVRRDADAKMAAEPGLVDHGLRWYLCGRIISQ